MSIDTETNSAPRHAQGERGHTWVARNPNDGCIFEGRRLVARFSKTIDRDFALQAANLYDDMLAALKFALVIIGHPDDDGTKQIAEVIAKAEGRS